MGLLTDFLGRRRVGRKPAENETASNSQYRCAQVRVGASGGCEAARALTTRRFLPDEIPTLPLPDCAKDACDCSFQLHDDRRKAPRPDADIH